MCYTCHCCGGVFKNRIDGRYDGHDNWVCESCLDNYYGRCDDCSEFYPEDELTEVDGDRKSTRLNSSHTS